MEDEDAPVISSPVVSHNDDDNDDDDIDERSAWLRAVARAVARAQNCAYVATAPPHASRVLCVSSDRRVAQAAVERSICEHYAVTSVQQAIDAGACVRTANCPLPSAVDFVQCAYVATNTWAVQTVARIAHS